MQRVPQSIAPLAHVRPLSERAAAMAATQPGEVLQSFVMQPQEHTLWCWAAVTASIAAYFNGLSGATSKTQCAVATDCLGFACCPPLPADWRGDQVYDLDAALRRVVQYQDGPLPVSGDDGTLFDLIKTEIDSGRPVACLIRETGLNAHYIAIIGYYDTAEREVEVRDPLDATHCGPFPLATVRNGLGGVLSYYYLTR